MSADSGQKPEQSSGPADVGRLRDAIDSGLTGDKNPAPDPAAAPLGTDDEAAGTPATASRGETALRQETGARPDGAIRPPAAPGPAAAGRLGPPYATLALIAVIVVAALVFIFVR